MEFKKEIGKTFDAIVFIKPNPFLLVEAEPLFGVSGIEPHAPIGIDDAVPRDVVLTGFVGAAEDTRDTL